MNNTLQNITNSCKTAVSVSKLYLKKNAPTILTITGLVSMTAGTIFAAKGTIKALEVKKYYEETREVIEEAHEDKNTKSEYTEEDYARDKQTAMAQLVMGMVKAYAPAVIFTALGFSAIISSNVIAKKRYMAIAAAYEAVNTAYNNYRERVRERFGDEVEQDIFLNRKTECIAQIGKEEGDKDNTIAKELMKTTEMPDDPYTFLYDEINSRTWVKSPSSRRIILEGMQASFNDRLKVDRYILLSDVLKELGFRYIPAYAHIVGWVKNHPVHSESDGFIDFGLDNIDHGYDHFDPTAGWWLTFNVDGNIYDLIDNVQKEKVY